MSRSIGETRSSILRGTPWASSGLSHDGLLLHDLQVPPGGLHSKLHNRRELKLTLLYHRHPSTDMLDFLDDFTSQVKLSYEYLVPQADRYAPVCMIHVHAERIPMVVVWLCSPPSYPFHPPFFWSMSKADLTYSPPWYVQLMMVCLLLNFDIRCSYPVQEKP